MKVIELTKGKHTIVDDEDVSLLSGYGWYATDTGYAACDFKIKGKRVHLYLHRLLLGLGDGDLRQADHINGDRLDNRRANLRVATISQNRRNRKPITLFKGVWKCHAPRLKTPTWTAMIGPSKNRKYLGNFSTPEEAAMAYDKAAKELYGEFARLNFKDCGFRECS